MEVVVKKIALLVLLATLYIRLIDAQGQQWVNYTNGEIVYSLICNSNRDN